MCKAEARRGMTLHLQLDDQGRTNDSDSGRYIRL